MRVKLVKSGEDLSDARVVRHEVFVKEQGFNAENEFDDIDATAHHLVYYNEENKPIATCRFFSSEENPEIYKMGRVAVLKEYRKTGIGHIMIKDMEREAKILGAISFWLSAQSTVRGFYEKAGYIVCGDEYMDEHCPHLPMEKKL